MIPRSSFTAHSSIAVPPTSVEQFASAVNAHLQLFTIASLLIAVVNTLEVQPGLTLREVKSQDAAMINVLPLSVHLPSLAVRRQLAPIDE
jgi:ABC-type proline/glycine betaine transport system permease subunit